MRQWPTNALSIGKGWEDLRVTAFSQKGANPPTLADFPAAASTVAGTEPQLWQYANNGNVQVLGWITQMSHTWDQTTAPLLHIHIANDGALLAGAIIGLFVNVYLQPIWVADAAAYLGTYWCSYTVPVGGILAKTHIMTDTLGIALPTASFGVSSLITGTVFRRKGAATATVNAGNVTDNLDDEIWFSELDIHFVRDRIGYPAVP